MIDIRDLTKAGRVLLKTMHPITCGFLHRCFVVTDACRGNRQNWSLALS